MALGLKSLLRVGRGGSGATVGVHFTDLGVAMARVAPQASGRPLLKQCWFRPAEEVDEAERKGLGVVREQKLGADIFVAVLSQGRYQLFPFEAPPVPEDEMAAAMRWRIKERLDYSPEEAVVDVFHLPKAGYHSKEEMVYVVAAHRQEVKGCAEFFQNAKLNLSVITIEELALRNLLERTEDNQEGTALLTLNRRGGMVMVVRKGAVFITRNTAMGHHQLLESVQRNPDAGLREMNDSPVLERLALEVQRTLDYYESHFGQNPVASLFLAPMEVQFSAMRQSLADKLGMRVKHMELNSFMDFAQPIDEASLALSLVAVGGALRTMEAPE